MQYLIYSRKHTNGIAMWWGPDGVGYTNNLDTAGRYLKDRAETFCRLAEGDAVPIAEFDAYRLVTRRIVDMADGNNDATLNKERR